MSKTYDELIKLCEEKIPRDVIEHREQSGKKLSYLPGWYVISRLNDVFGQTAWSYQSSVEKLFDGQVETSKGATNYVSYKATVRLVVDFGNGKQTEFTDVGFGDGQDKNNPGKAHELAMKEAVTDGLKRCARCLGNSFGNGLYDKSGDGIASEDTEVHQETPKDQVPPTTSRETINKLISQYSKVIVDKKLRTLEDLKAILGDFKVSKKEDLTDAQANEVLAVLKKILA